MSCRSCGRENPAGSRFCFGCGTPLAMTCSGCGAALPRTANPLFGGSLRSSQIARAEMRFRQVGDNMRLCLETGLMLVRNLESRLEGADRVVPFPVECLRHPHVQMTGKPRE